MTVDAGGTVEFANLDVIGHDVLAAAPPSALASDAAGNRTGAGASRTMR